MSKFLTKRYKNLTPYTPGEQPKDQKYIKLNTNELPFAPSERLLEAVAAEAQKLQLYPDPTYSELSEIAAESFGIQKDQIVFGNGSDEILNFAFMAFCDEDHPAYFPDITYGFYPVYADLNHVVYHEIPLQEDFTINIEDYFNVGGTIFIANPNAPTGIALTLDEIELILQNNPDNIVVIDEAYVDFGAAGCVPLIEKYENLLVVQTCSKSRGLAGARLGMGIACESLIADLNTIRFSTNPYNVNRMTAAAGKVAIAEKEVMCQQCGQIAKTRFETPVALQKLGFELTPSVTNFIFAKHPAVSGEELYLKLKAAGILVRHFNKERICEYNRITIGTADEMASLVAAIEEILG